MPAAAVAAGFGSVMALETLSPDWEFDRVDDGSQSKRKGKEGGGACLLSENSDGDGGWLFVG